MFTIAAPISRRFGRGCESGSAAFKKAIDPLFVGEIEWIDDLQTIPAEAILHIFRKQDHRPGAAYNNADQRIEIGEAVSKGQIDCGIDMLRTSWSGDEDLTKFLQSHAHILGGKRGLSTADIGEFGMNL